MTTSWTPLPIEQGGTGGTTPLSARRALGLQVPTGGAANVNFLPAGAGAVPEPVQTALRRTVFAGQYGAVGDDVADDNVHLQALLNLGGKLILGGGKTYRNFAANLTFVANTELWIERGTTLHLDTTRLTALNVNDVQIHNYGVIKSTGLNTTDALPTNWNGRGIVEFGGTIASPALRVGIDGPGTVFGDFVGTPGTGPAIGATDKRRGILFNNVQSAWAKFNNVYGIIAEAIWHNGTVGVDQDIDIDYNRIHDCNHDAISAQQTVTTTFRTRGNIGWNCAVGVEASVGDHQHNLMFNMIGSGYAMGGTSPADNGSPVIYANNTGINNGNSGAGSSDFDLEGATTAGGVVIVQNNTSYNAGAFGFFVSFAKTAIITGNKAYGWGTTAAGSGLATANCTNVIVDGNGLANENAAHSNGGYNIGATGQVIFGNSNTVFGVVTPYVNFSSAAQGLKPSPVPVYSRVGQSSHTGDTNPFTLGTYTVKAHTCGLTGGVRVTAGGTLAGVANTKTLNLSYGGNNFAQLIIPAAATRWRLEAEFYNVGTTGNQAYSNTGLSGTAVISTDSGTMATDSTVDKDIVLSVTNQNAGDTLTQNIFMIEPIIGMTQ